MTSRQRAIFQHVAIPQTDLPTNQNVVPGATLKIYEPDGVTVLRQRIYAGPSGGSPIGNPITTNAAGYARCYAERAQPVMVAVNGSTPIESGFLADGRTTETDVHNVRSYPYLAVGDGASHPLSDSYGTLAAAQVDYPHATSLTNEIDWAAIQLAINDVRTEQGGTVLIPRGRYRINQTLTMPHTPNLTLAGTGAGVLGIVLNSPTNDTLNASGSVLVNYTGGTMVALVQQYDDGQPQASGIYCRDLAFEATNNATDVNFYATATVVGGAPQVAGRLAFERCTFVRGLKSFYAKHFFDIRFSHCYFNGGSANGQYFSNNGDVAVYFEGSADMLHMDQCFLTTWNSNFRANPANVDNLHPYRLWFSNTKFELARQHNVDVRNCENAYFDFCHFEASAQDNLALYHDVYFGAVVGADSLGSVYFRGSDFAAGNAYVLVQSANKFGTIHMVDCWTSTSSTTATVLLDNSGVSSPKLQGSAIFEGCRFHSGVNYTNFLGDLRFVGCVNQVNGTIVPSDFSRRLLDVDVQGVSTVSVDYADQISLSTHSAGTAATISQFTVISSDANTLVGRRLLVTFTDGDVTLVPGGAFPYGITPYGSVNKNYGAGTMALFIHSGGSWVEQGRLT